MLTQHRRRNQRNARRRNVKARLVRGSVFPDHHAFGNHTSLVDDDAADPAATVRS